MLACSRNARLPLRVFGPRLLFGRPSAAVSSGPRVARLLGPRPAPVRRRAVVQGGWRLTADPRPEKNWPKVKAIVRLARRAPSGARVLALSRECAMLPPRSLSERSMLGGAAAARRRILRPSRSSSGSSAERCLPECPPAARPPIISWAFTVAPIRRARPRRSGELGLSFPSPGSRSRKEKATERGARRLR